MRLGTQQTYQALLLRGRPQGLRLQMTAVAPAMRGLGEAARESQTRRRLDESWVPTGEDWNHQMLRERDDDGQPPMHPALSQGLGTLQKDRPLVRGSGIAAT